MLYKGKQHLPYAAGKKIYGGGTYSPNLGVSDPTGYNERSLKYHQARRAAMLRRLKAKSKGEYMSPDVGRKI